MKSLDLGDLSQDRPALSGIRGAACAEAAAVCLDANGHSAGVSLAVKATSSHSYTVTWTLVSEMAKATWHDLQEAAEQGSYGMATLLVEELLDYTVVERSVKGTGFDYYVGPIGGDAVLFQDLKRLEVSSIIHKGDISGRVKEKLKQVARSSALGLPAVIVVIEYGTPKAEVLET